MRATILLAAVIAVAPQAARAHASGHEICDYSTGKPLCTSSPEGAYVLYTRQAETIAKLQAEIRRLQSMCPSAPSH